MTGSVDASLAGEQVTSKRAEARSDHGAIFHPVVDFLCLGGLSLALIPVLLMLPDEAKPSVMIAAFLLADVVNNPHFAHSYQIFYRGYREKAFGHTLPRDMRIRYQAAGMYVPLLLVAFFAWAVMRPDPTVLGYTANIMFLLVGWHYTKQGYGMLMVDAAFKRRFFSASEKRILLLNVHACWVMFWVLLNKFVAEQKIYSVEFYTFAIPDLVRYAVVAFAVCTSVAAIGVFARKALIEGKPLPWTGVMAYLVSGYVWLGVSHHPVAIVLVPFFHSLQYLLIVYRYEVNRSASMAELGETGGMSVGLKMLTFAITGIVMGLAGFWWIPKLMEGSVAIDTTVFGPGTWLFIFFVFINTHHYFMDNVIWRRENPDTQAYLFGARK